ncbi:MAG: DUF192 domain-containing protein [Phycisphaerales bacterium]
MATRINRSFLLSWLAMFFMLGMIGCSKPSVVDGLMPVEIGPKTFELEIVADPATRELGLGGRTAMAPDHGMLFSFPDSKLRRFVMRDCSFDIDIIFLDSAGRITAMHTMPIEEPKKDDETQYAYEVRLEKYSSRFNAQYAIELVGGMIDTLDLEEGQQIELDTEYLQSVTK